MGTYKKQNCRRSPSCGLLHGVDVEAQGGGSTRERGDPAFAQLLFVAVALLTLVDKGLTAGQLEVHRPRRLWAVAVVAHGFWMRSRKPR